MNEDKVFKGDFKKEIFNTVNENVKALEALFPSVVKDGQVDFEALKEELGQFEEVGIEKYGLTWAGKQNAKKNAQEDIVGKTLKFIPEESKDVETTENLYIEGDNLEVLKLLRQNYYGAIKMIYIDPPYNTGNDFIYNDEFIIKMKNSDIEEGIRDDEGNVLQKNQKSTNRYHANWINMIYPRLKVAKDLLKEDGILFASIGQEEVISFSQVLNEIFGEENKLSIISRVTKTASNNGTFFAPTVDYVLCYAKNINNLDKFYDLVDEGLYKKVETEGLRKGEKYRDDVALYQAALNDLRPNQKYFIECPDGSKVIPPCSILDEIMREGDGRWRWSKEKYMQEKHMLVFKKTSKSPLLDEHGNKAQYNVYTKSYLSDRQEAGTLPREFWTDFINRKGADLLKKYDIPFDFSKPVELIKYILQIIRCGKEEIIMDFFSGSATTAHAVMELNAEDGGKRKFIMVQLPEPIEEKSKAYNLGYKTICDIGKERIRRVASQFENIDKGFKVFRVSDTNIRWEYEDIKVQRRNLMQQETQLQIAATKQKDVEQIDIATTMMSDKDQLDFMPGTKDINVVYELLLRQRDIPLSARVEVLSEIGERTYLFAQSYLVCLETEITNELIEKIATINPLPIKFIFRDSAFEDDINLKDETIRRFKAFVARNTGEKQNAYTVEFI